MLEVAPYDRLEADACRPENGFGCEVMASLPHVDSEASRRGIQQWRLDIAGDLSVVTQHGGEHHAGESEGYGERKGGGTRCRVRRTYICRTWYQMLHAAREWSNTHGDVCLRSQRARRRRDGCAVGSANPYRGQSSDVLVRCSLNGEEMPSYAGRDLLRRAC